MLLLFLSFRAVTNHGPKDNPLPRQEVSSEQILNGKESLSCTFPAGDSFTLTCSRVSQSKPTREQITIERWRNK